jgi:uncharacterized protein (TIGR03067 family)
MHGRLAALIHKKAMDRRTLTLTALATALLAACASPPHVARSIHGRWQPVSAQMGGRDLPLAAFKGAVLNLEPGKYDFGGDQGEFVLGLPGPPAQMDIRGRVGPNAGKTILAIYALTQDELVICYQLGAGPRPSVFKSPSGSQVLLMRYKAA